MPRNLTEGCYENQSPGNQSKRPIPIANKSIAIGIFPIANQSQTNPNRIWNQSRLVFSQSRLVFSQSRLVLFSIVKKRLKSPSRSDWFFLNPELFFPNRRLRIGFGLVFWSPSVWVHPGYACHRARINGSEGLEDHHDQCPASAESLWISSHGGREVFKRRQP